jgi:hypothetical protein
MLHAQLGALALAATALVASGCGGSSKSGTTHTVVATAATTTANSSTVPTAGEKVAAGKPLTRAELVARANAICGSTHTKLSAISVKTGEQFTRVLPQIAIYDSVEFKELRKLTPPASMAHEWARIVGGVHLYSEYVNRIANYAQANNSTSAAPLFRAANALHRQLVALAAHNGIRHC